MGDGNVYHTLSANQGHVLYEMITNVATDNDVNVIFGS